jgi:hypothetical protein
MIQDLQESRPPLKNSSSQETFELKCGNLIKRLLLARQLVLQSLRDKTSDLSPFDWFCIQKTDNAQQLFRKIYHKLRQLPRPIFETIYAHLSTDFCDKLKGRLIFDESQHLFTTLSASMKMLK